MKYLVQKIKKKERAKSESEYVKRLQEEDTGIEEVSLPLVPTQKEVQEQPFQTAAQLLPIGNIINTAKGPVIAGIKKIGQDLPVEEMTNIAKRIDVENIRKILRNYGSQFEPMLDKILESKNSTPIKNEMLKKLQKSITE